MHGWLGRQVGGRWEGVEGVEAYNLFHPCDFVK